MAVCALETGLRPVKVLAKEGVELTKPEARSPKSEIRKKSEVRSPNGISWTNGKAAVFST
jgi:hypothetical protein